MTRLLSRISTLLCCLWIFLIPTSLAYHFNTSAGLVHGILVDYRIPTITLTAIIGTVALTALIATRSTPSLKTVALTLWGTALFQFGWALLQWVTQKSLTGYFPFGESTLSSPQIVRSIWIDGSLKILPYGTTVHPHILATFFVVTALLSLQFDTIFPHRKNRLFQMTIFLMSIVICVLTQSLVASLALGVGILVHVISAHTKYPKVTQQSIRIALILIPLFSALCLQTTWATSSQDTSILRRAQLETISLQMIRHHPLIGVGWNNFTRDMEQYGYVTSTVRFLQPVHNVPLLLISELGVVGWFAIVTLTIMILRSSPQHLAVIAALVITASFDHFLLTLTTGRMLVILILFYFFFLERKSQSRHSTDSIPPAV